MKAMSTIVPFSNEDPDKLFICPYDEVHLIRACRFNQHLRKCRQNHGGHGFKICTFNHSHHVPSKDFERHLMECPDKGLIQQDIDAAQRPHNPLPPVDHHPVWNKPESTEDWDTEVAIEQQVIAEIVQQEDMAEEYETVEEDEFHMKELLPEHPHNWESMTATQKKNYKRKYNKQQTKMKEKGLTPADFQKSKDPRDWTEEERKAKLDLMVSLYPPSKIGGAFIDYKTVLNQYCQKNKINTPKYAEASATFGGFASRVTVKGEEYESHGVHKTKREAAHDSAKWALLAMDVPEEELNKTDYSRKPRAARTMQDAQMLRSRHEIGMIHHAGQIQAQARPVQQVPYPSGVRKLNTNVTPNNSQARPLLTPQTIAQPVNDVTQTMQRMSIQPQANAEDEWHTVGSRRPPRQGRAGRGRGTALSSFT